MFVKNWERRAVIFSNKIFKQCSSAYQVQGVCVKAERNLEEIYKKVDLKISQIHSLCDEDGAATEKDVRCTFRDKQIAVLHSDKILPGSSGVGENVLSIHSIMPIQSSIT